MEKQVISLLKRLEVKDNEIIVFHMKDCSDISRLQRCFRDFTKKNKLKAFFILTTDGNLDVSKMSKEQKEWLLKTLKEGLKHAKTK